MIGFFVKKAFFDGWDNIFSLAALNSLHLLLFLLFGLLPGAVAAPDALIYASFALGIFAMSFWQSVVGFAMNSVSDYAALSFRKVFGYFRAAAVPGLFLGLSNIILFYAVSIGIPFYLMQSGILALLMASLLFWMVVAALLSLQYFIALQARRGGKIKANLKASAMIFLDNPGFSIFLFLHRSLTFAVSAACAFLAPGLAGMSLASADAVKLRLLKYRWLEETPGADRRHIPWDELLEEEKELVGKRTLKGMIFPWKEGK